MSNELNFIPISDSKFVTIKDFLDNLGFIYRTDFIKKVGDIKIAFDFIKCHPNYSQSIIDNDTRLCFFGHLIFKSTKNEGIEYLNNFYKYKGISKDSVWIKTNLSNKPVTIYDIIKIKRNTFFACGELSNRTGILYYSEDRGKNWIRIFSRGKPIYGLSFNRSNKKMILYQDFHN